MIRGHAVRAQQREVFDIVRGLDLLAIDRIVEANLFATPRGTRKRSAKVSPAAARRSLSARESSRIPGLKSQV